jgi:hypothetical protein
MLLASASSFFSSGTWFVIRSLLALFGVVFWLATAWWVYKDARRRMEDPVLIGTAVLLGLVVPFLGPFIYMLFRPPEYLEDVRERELEIRATCTVPSVAARWTRRSSCAPSARRSSSRRARTARRRSRLSGRCARTARRRSSRRL